MASDLATSCPSAVGAELQHLSARPWIRIGSVLCAFLIGAAATCFSLMLCAGVTSASAAEAPLPACQSSAMYIVAHEDDTLLFQSPSVLQDIQSARCVRTVFLTAGDNGLGQSYWSTREEGAEAAYAQMAGASNKWSESTIFTNGHSIVLETLVEQPRISLVFMRMPDGGYPAGTGTARYGYQSLMQLWDSGNPGSGGPAKSSITTVDGSNTYGYQDLINTLASLMQSFEPQLIATQDFTETFTSGDDHRDHIATAYFARAASKLYEAPHQLVGYEDYDTVERPQNVFGSLLEAKEFAFYAYGIHDSEVCSTEGLCAGTEYAAWLKRRYIVGTEPVGVVANAGYAQTASPHTVVTLNGSLSGDESGHPLNYQWSQTGGPPVNLAGSTTVAPSFAVPAGPTALTFSLTVADGLITSRADTVTVTVPGSASPTAVAGAAETVSSGATVALNGSASSDPNNLPLNYTWTQLSGPAVSLSNSSAAQPTFVAPPGPASLTFSLVVSNGTESSVPATVTVGVNAVNPGEANVALLATASASSESTVNGQTASRAIDGVISGYPEDPTAEWATEGGKAGSTLTLKWTKSNVLDHVILYDRPNANDQITAGKLTFSDGSTVNFGALPNAGATGLVVSFPPHATTSLKMTVSSVSSTTLNVGLSEIQAWGVASVSPTISSAASASFTTGAEQSFTVVSTGNPAATLSESGTLPSGVKFIANGNGTATISGTPASSSAPAGSSKTYPVTLTASNASGSVTQHFTLTVINNEPASTKPIFTTPSSGTGKVGKALSIPIEAAGAPLPTLSLSGSAPSGLSFKATGAGKATLSGTPRSSGTSRLTMVAKNSAGTTSQTFTLVIER